MKIIVFKINTSFKIYFSVYFFQNKSAPILRSLRQNKTINTLDWAQSQQSVYIHYILSKLLISNIPGNFYTLPM